MIVAKSIPSMLRDQKHWVNWKLVSKGGRPTKIPFQPNGNPASSTDDKTWNTFDECIKVEKNFNGIGFVFKKGDGVVGIDLDGCRNPETGSIDKWAMDIIAMMGTYTEISPSKTGVKMFGLNCDEWNHINKIELPGNGYGDKKPGIEVYQHSRYFAVTGLQVGDNSTLSFVDDQLEWLATEYKMRRESPVFSDIKISSTTSVGERASKYLAKMQPAIDGQGGHKATFTAACALVKGFGLSVDEALSLLVHEYNPRCLPPWSEKELRHKCESASKQPGSVGYLADAMPDKWDRIAIPATYKEQVVKHEKQSTKSVRKTTLKDAVDAKIKSLSSGKIKLVGTGVPMLDHNIGGGLAFGEMLVMAARPSHGKSAVALQMAHTMTLAGVPVAIVSEEMSADALAKRTIQYGSLESEEEWHRDIEGLRGDMDRHFSGRADAIILESCGSISSIIDEVERVVDENGVKAVFIDYVQIINAPGMKSTYDRVSHVSSSLRLLASRKQIIVVALAQLNRGIEGRQHFIPMMSDLRDSGQIEQDADIVLFGVWPHRTNPESPAKYYQFFICKNRNRGIGKNMLEVEFDPSRQKFSFQGSECNADFK